MKKTTVFFFILFAVISCHDSTNPKSLDPKMVPDHTPYIAGLIEASPDTTFHYSEIIIGYFTDHQNPQATGILPRQSYNGIYNLTLFRQVTQTSILFALSWQPESRAVVTVSGPLGTPQEEKVKFISEGNGIYGDKDYDLLRVANGRYRLQVKLPGGKVYSSKTYIPGVARMNLKDSARVKVEYTPYNDGTPRESADIGYPIAYHPSKDGFLTIFQWNSNRDRDLLLLKPNEKFKYADHSNYLREGTGYAVTLANPAERQEKVFIPWNQELSKKAREEVWNNQHWWLRSSFFSKGISKMFFPLVNLYVAGKKWREKYNDAPADSALAQDTHYLHNVSTIRKVGQDGKVLPQDSTDAIGFFAGEYSRYLQTTLYANRQFDLDSVLTAWENRNE